MPRQQESTKSDVEISSSTVQSVATPDGSTTNSNELDNNVCSRPSSAHTKNIGNDSTENEDKDSTDDGTEWKAIPRTLFHPERSITPMEARDYNHCCSKGYNMRVKEHEARVIQEIEGKYKT
jgi:hypothetical protein